MERPGTSDIFAIGLTAALVAGVLTYERNSSFQTAVDSLFSSSKTEQNNRVNYEANAKDMPCEAGQIIFGVQTSKNEVAITIDDGPSQTTTLQNLEIAKKHGAHLTFFAIADRIQTPEGSAIAKKIIADGHELNVHSLTHTLGKPDVNALEHTSANQIFLQNIGQVPYANRAPGLAYSDAYVQAVKNAGQCFIDVSQGSDTKDWQCDLQTDPAKALAGIEDRAKKVRLANGSFVLMHDQYNDNHERPRINSPHELDILLTRLESEGKKAVTVSQLLQDGTPVLQSSPDNSQEDC